MRYQVGQYQAERERGSEPFSFARLELELITHVGP
jgi:hypothetical protein